VTYVSTGSGTLSYRVVIDGSPFEAVSHPSMASAWPPASATAVTRVEGLKIADARFSQKVDPVACKLDVGGLQISFVDINNAWSQLFDAEPTAVTWLTADVNATDATIPVLSTEGFEGSEGTIWIDGEAIAYTGLTSTTFPGCTRGAFSADSDAAQWHYISDGTRLQTPEVTNWPTSWRERRVTIFRYDDQDDPTGDGTQIYRGVTSSDPHFDGLTWTISVDHVTSVLEQTFGNDLNTPLSLRGIHYTTQSPFHMQWLQFSSATFVTAGTVDLTGYYETQEDFRDALNTALTASLAAATPAGNSVITKGRWCLLQT